MVDPVVNIWVCKPHVAHKQIFGSQIIHSSDHIIRRIIYPKLYVNVDPWEETITIEKSDQIYYTFCSESYSYTIIKSESFSIVPGVKADSKIVNEEWLKGVLEVKLNFWLNQNISSSPPSLFLVNLREYQLCYDDLKVRYAKSIASFWCEKTNPDKFIHEDLGIAAYLLCLWRNDTIKKPRFVDVGCGNGLLVHILNSEGFEGVGVDIRKRKIWDLYPDITRRNLVETTVNPQTHSGFPEADWLIGNHTDELTPWLPILATRSNPRCRVLVIPCCPFSLYQKFDLGKHKIPIDSAVEEGNICQGRFRGYVYYLKSHFESCGFVSELDILRIPSTKRFCIIGRNFTSDDWETRLENVNSVIRSEGEVTFETRKDRSGSTFGSLSLDEIIYVREKIFQRVLELGSIEGTILTVDGRRWNPGGCLSIKEACQLLEPEVIAKLKFVQGGLQTVLRNQYQTFMVTGEGIRLRYDSKHQERIAGRVKGGKPRKTKSCWMEVNHPDGCPYPPFLCCFAHRDEQTALT